MIKFDDVSRQIHLSNDFFSYIMEINKNNHLLHVYYGEHIRAFTQVNAYPIISRSSHAPNPQNLDGTFDRELSMDALMQEYPGFDTSDFRESAFEFTYSDGTKATSLRYVSHSIYQGKPKIIGLPATYVISDEKAETIEITLADDIRKVEVVLIYSVFSDLPVLAKSVKVVNNSTTPIVLNRVLSSCIDFSDCDYDFLSLNGGWARENHLERYPLTRGIHTIDSKKGISGLEQHPFVGLLGNDTNEFSGEVYGTHIVYSGNFSITMEVDNYNQTRILAGINSHNFTWQLSPGEMFATPEVIHVYGKAGLNGMSQTFHHLYRNHLVRGPYQFQERPILNNSWETTYFDIDEQKILKLAESSKKIGVELLVVDDGWFGHRNSDTRSLGDWIENQEKFPNGLPDLVKTVKEKGLKFGLWFEPEMISPESDLFAEHPDWHIQVNNYPSSRGRDQYVLDFSREEVREAIFLKLCDILDRVDVDYVKWDFNRTMTEMGSLGRASNQQMETGHRYILGLYEFLERLTQKYPHILFENCSSGGGRFDPGMLYYMPQSWTSDNTDAIERIKIQYGTSLLFPPVMMCAQLSTCPNHQVQRITPVKTRAAVAMSGNFGIMLDFHNETPETLEGVEKAICLYKQYRQLIQFGNFYRLVSPFEDQYNSAWMIVSSTREIALLYLFQQLEQPSKPIKKVKLFGLDEGADYRIGNLTLSGEELMKFGLYYNHLLKGDFDSQIIIIEKVMDV